MSREEERNLSDNINPRDSGIAGSFVHDNTINENSSSSEEEENKQQENPNLPIIEEVSSDSESVVSLVSTNSNMADEQPVTPSQLSALPTFDGERGEGFVNWLERLEVAQVTYNWDIDSLVQVAKAKGGSKVAEWDRGNRLRGQVRDRWGGAGGFRAALYGRFGPKYTSATAVNAVADLKMKAKESCASFLDRVVLAVDKQHFNVTAAQKREAGYRAVAEASIMSHFGAGLREDIKRIVLGAANPPETVDDMLSAAEAIEAELAKTGPPGASALAVGASLPGEPAEEDTFGYEESLACLDSKVEELVAAVQRFRRKPLDRSKIQCYNCHRYGHFRNECKEPQRPQGGRGQSVPGGTSRRGGYTPSPPGRWRSQNAVEPGPSPIQPPSDEHQDDSSNYNAPHQEEEEISGNF